MSFRTKGLSAIAAAAMSLALAAPASAVPITGTLSITGADVIDYVAHTITFVAGSSAVGVASGSFATAGFNGNPGADAVTMRNEGTAVSYTSPALTAGSNLSCGAGCIFTAASGTGNNVGFNITGPYSVTEVAGVSLNILAPGTVTLTGFDPTEGTFNFSTQGPGGTTAVTFSATVSVPFPAVGAGLPGLLAACGGLIALARRRRARTA